MWNRSSLKFKLIASFLAVSAFTVIVGVLGFFTLQSVVSAYGRIAKHSLPAAIALADMRASSMAVVRNVTVLSNPRLNDSIRADYEKKLDRRLDMFAQANAAYVEIPFVEGEEVLFNDVIGKWKVLETTVKDLRPKLASKDPAVQAQVETVVLGKLDDEMDAFTEAIGKLRAFQSELAKRDIEGAEVAYSRGNTSSIVVVVIGCLISGLIGLFFATSMSRRFIALSDQLAYGAEEVASASQQISSASEQLSAAAAEQAASLQETSASVEEISAMINKNTENANQSRTASETTRTASESGRKSVDEMISAVQAISVSNGEIGSRIEESNREITEIVKVINEIGNKTKVINDIVFQTKLLSFNASVEAARAGEHGKGFAVVAEEVGNLAQMSGNAAKEISDMLESSIQKVESTVQRMQVDLDRLMGVGREKVSTGQNVAERCGEILGEVVTQVSQVNRMSLEIASASTEQSQGVQEISNAMRQLDQVTQQNASAAHQAASASTELSGQAEKLHGLVNDLTVFIQGAGAQTSRTGTRREPAARPVARVVPINRERQPVVGSGPEPMSSDVRFKDI